MKPDKIASRDTARDRRMPAEQEQGCTTQWGFQLWHQQGEVSVLVAASWASALQAPGMLEDSADAEQHTPAGD